MCAQQALELQAGCSADSNNGQDVCISQQQWDQFLVAFRDRLKLLRLIANVGRVSTAPGEACVWVQGSCMQRVKPCIGQLCCEPAVE
jgi:hypothetical protein